ncbi:hypothetical protein P691DRAFT_810561 [Macrolepiota fuliginosa MF-IS2]|uniref:Secreted protein n=1 Tax=Macrolepiota fuliginosa MF-IS2 TaxID=1400762 RepID=A0A9P6BYI5_9AGAR|nr:hypothetical protein P691DRAFT_810561 [Macrolepiota fuliginosa MF-IS2]
MLVAFPIFVVHLLGLVQVLGVTFDENAVGKIPSMRGWTSLVYCFCGTRLILNLRKANCKLTESIYSQQHSTIRFDHSNHQNHGEAAADSGEILEEIRH